MPDNELTNEQQARYDSVAAVFDRAKDELAAIPGVRAMAPELNLSPTDESDEFVISVYVQRGTSGDVSAVPDSIENVPVRILEVDFDSASVDPKTEAIASFADETVPDGGRYNPIVGGSASSRPGRLRVSAPWVS